jgi:hypothetical protein
MVGGHALALRSAVIASRDMVTGDGSIAQLKPGPRYELLRVPDTPVTERYHAERRLAGDFAQVYFPARSTDRTVDGYSTSTPDPWGRPSRYPPFDHWACAVSICQLPYGWASLAHMALQYAVFMLSLVYAFRIFQLSRYFAATALFVHVGLFLTPVGLAWFERGQFSLYIGAAYLWLLLGIYKDKALFLALAALLGYLKWTSFPMLFVVIAVWLLIAPDWPTFNRRLRMALWPVVVVIALFVLFPRTGVHYLEGLAYQEGQSPPLGLSLARLLPRWFVKGLPLALVVIGVFRGRRQSMDAGRLLPFWLGAAIVLLVYPTLAFDYSVPSLFGLIPFAIDWVASSSTADLRASWFVPALFLLFIVGASTITIVNAFAGGAADTMLTWGYVACGALLLSTPAPSSRLQQPGSRFAG